jgi:phage terminase large subunit
MVVDVKGRGGRIVRFVPLPRQVEAIDALDGRPTYILIGGAAGGSKSKGLREIAHSKCMSTPNFRVLLLRRTYKELDQTHIRDAEIEAPEMGAQAVPSAKLVRYPNGSTLQFGHCETSADAANYLSAEYDLIIFDELVTFEELQFLLISSRARSTKPGVRPKILAGTNPGGPQAYWVRSRFIDKNVDTDMYPDYEADEYCYIPSKLDDNPYLDQAYERKLLALPPELRRAYREGDWDIFPGQYFPEWRKATHVTAEHISYPASFTRSLSLDWGFVKPGSCGFWVDVDGHKYREDEYIFSRTTAFDVGCEIGRRVKAAGYTKIRHMVYDTAMQIPSNDTGESTIATVLRGVRSMGVSLSAIPADKERVNGWQRLRHWLRLAPDGKPWLQSSPLCAYFNRTIPSLVSAASNPEDVNTDGEDHAADEARYEVMASPIPSGHPAEAMKVKPGMVAWLRQQAIRGSSGNRRYGQVA